MSPHEELIENLTQNGFHAGRRDWILGETVYVSRRSRRTENELRFFDGLIYLVREEDTWALHYFLSTPGGLAEHGYSAREVCERVRQLFALPEDVLMGTYNREQKKSGNLYGVLEYWFPDCLPADEVNSND